MTTTPSEPQHVGPYRLIEKIGEGGMGMVYLALRPAGDLVALKVLRPWLVGGHDARQRFEQELATLRRVRSPRIAEVIDADVTCDMPYIATRFVRGSSLDKVVSDHGPLRGHALTKLADGLAEAVEAVHEAGVVHRDIKPGNVMVTEGGPVLIDFGLARMADETRLTATGMVIGTPGYLAPEVVDGHPPQPASDVHGWAATVAFAATGRAPYGSGPAAVVLDRIRRGELNLEGAEESLAQILGRALVADPSARPPIQVVRSMLANPAAYSTYEPAPHQSANSDGGDAPTLTDAPAVPAAAGASTAQTKYATTTRIQKVPLPAADRLAPAQVGAGAPARNHRGPKPPITLWPEGVAPPLTTWPARLVILAAAVVIGLLLGAVNGLGVLMLYGTLVTARVTWRIRRSLYYRRAARGYQPQDNMKVAAGTPWYLLISMAISLLQVALIAIAGYAVGWGVNASGDPAGAVTAFSVVVVVLAWAGPGTSKVRHGIRGLAVPLDRNRRAAWITFGVLFALVWVLLLIWVTWPPDWPPGGVRGPAL